LEEQLGPQEDGFHASCCVFLGILGAYDHVENPCLETIILDGIPTQTGDMTGVGMEQLADTGAD